MLPKLKVPFPCTGNSCRSPIAECWARALHVDRREPCFAGSAPGRVDPRAIQVMREVGVDIAGHSSKHHQELTGVDVEGSLETRLEAFREVRDGIERRILDRLRNPEPGRIGARG